MFYITHENLPPQTEVHYGMGDYMNCILQMQLFAAILAAFPKTVPGDIIA